MHKGRTLLGGPNSFNFMQFLGNFDKIVLAPPGGLAFPPRENPGSTTVIFGQLLPGLKS